MTRSIRKLLGVFGRCPSGRSAAATRLSRFASQAKPAATIAGTGLLILLLCFVLPAIFGGS